MAEVLIVINPGSTSTKFAIWSREGSLLESTVRHEAGMLASRAVDQFDYRKGLIDSELLPALKDHKVVGVVGRGGLLKPLHGGTWLVNSKMIEDLNAPQTSNHASNLGAILAEHYAKLYGTSAYIVDPVTVDEFVEVARVSGVPWCDRKSRAHALNIKYTVRRAAQDIGKPLDETRFVVAHFGGGTSVAAVLNGKIIDSNDALLGMGPFSPERAGALPIGAIVERCFTEGMTKKAMFEELGRKAGLMAYCGTSDVREVLKMIDKGDQKAELAFNAMVYQDAKEIGAMATVLEGWIDAVLLTGGLAHSEEFLSALRPYISYLGELLVYPGEGELEALAAGGFRVIDGLEAPGNYK